MNNGVDCTIHLVKQEIHKKVQLYEIFQKFKKLKNFIKRLSNLKNREHSLDLLKKQ